MEDEICEGSEDGKHVADWNSVHINFDQEIYIDVNCLHCGQSGCVGSEKTLESEISW